MKGTGFSLLALVFCSAARVAAAQGINLAWDNCIAVTAGTNPAHANVNYACDGSRTTPLPLVFSFIAPQSMPSFIAAEAVIGTNTDAASVPDYWRLGIGECREGALSLPGTIPGVGNTTTCRNSWTGAQITTAWQWNSGTPSMGRTLATFSVMRDSPTALNAGQQYVGGVATIDLSGGAPEADCLECEVPICLELLSVRLIRSGEPDVVLNTVGTRTQAFWWGGISHLGVGGCWTFVPDAVVNRTWGSVKATYR